MITRESAISANRRRRLRLTVAATALVTAASTITALAFAGPATALPIGQEVCAFDNLTISPATGWFPLTPARSITPGTETVAKATVAADVAVDTGAEVRLGWSINNSVPQESFFGPANFANHTEFAETRESFGLVFVGAGTTSIQPFVRVSGPAGKRAGLLNRCLALEAQTR
ncbi:hypothetical protein ILP97_31125 [Amycolatopsis sp. H6(2020)]|nr:hypothetical protein [Amycolatopsis sp. H6(2020)]